MEVLNQLTRRPINGAVPPEIGEPTYEDCKRYSAMLSKQIKDTLIPKMRAQGIKNCIFTDLQTQPEFSVDKNPYKMLMTVLKQYAGVVMGGYTAYVLLADREREIARLEREVERLTQKF